MVAIIKYNSGNVQSVQYALHRIGVESVVTDDADEIRLADKVIFPGVGHAQSAMHYLREKHLDQLILSLKQPVDRKSTRLNSSHSSPSRMPSSA